MILKGKERGNGKQLATYLLTLGENEHVELHDLRGFASANLRSALQEIDAIARGTKARNTMFSLSLNPPPQERVKVQAFEDAIGEIEQKLGLQNQPRAIVFHEKDGRRHAHVVWSRIDSREMKAINLPHFKRKLMDVSRQLFIEQGWRLPKGFTNSRERDPKNYSLEEYQQAKRAKADPKALKAMFIECWAVSDSGRAYAQALAARGYTLAHGDRRGYVAVDFRGEVYAVAKWTGLKAKDTRGRLDALTDLPTFEQAKAATAEQMTDRLREYVAQVEATRDKQLAKLAAQKTCLVEKQQRERTTLNAVHDRRWTAETAERASRLNKGVRGLWDRLTGRHTQQTRDNQREALESLRRDRREKDALIECHLDERRDFHALIRQVRNAHARNMESLHQEIASYAMDRERGHPDAEKRLRQREKEHPRKSPGRDSGPERGR